MAHSAPSLDAVPSAESRVREVNGVRLHVVEAGDPDGPAVVLLHGFPDFWYGWHEQLPPLVEAGYRVVVPDQRGYNRSDKPVGVGSYTLPTLSADIAALVRAVDRDAAHVVGHDWGGIVAWDLALRRPSVVESLATLNAPHPGAFERRLRRDPGQLARSWYAGLFQLPWLPEWALTRDDAALLAWMLKGTAAPDTFGDAELARYREAWTRERAVASMVNWYRAFPRSPRPTGRASPPTLVCWGERDPALRPRLARESVDRCADGRLRRFPDASHWVHRDRPDEVNAALLDHLHREREE
ncbi:alpha/beta fold hydrolase [Candidatus Halobonum tyrrellensis]|uniref:Alpha/beta hydrolase n=1 Tax=Candidatus Halobonum tyrrellensis G22 TaxID=1324957 RepID=V4HCW1_9EURY|nr:alpha/beta fold hydrolase [Candidatus Halobonum tyrrellensis]ESP88555.1 alpha/beta hydrolase [Candidatus Halobonum tyrrellensis G22]